MNYIITNNRSYFEQIGKYNYCKLEDMILPKTIAIDFETEGLDPKIDKIFSVQIGTGKNNYLIDLQNYTPIENIKKIKFSDVAIYIKDKTLVGHNILFDLQFMYMEGFFPDKIHDTMTASKILHNGEHASVTHGFGQVMERELGLEYDKSEQKNIHKVRLSTARAIQYCFNDVDKLLLLSTDLIIKLQAYGSIESYNLNCNFLLSLAYMQLCGLPLNTALWQEKMEKDKLDSLKFQEEINDYIYDNLPKFRKKQQHLFDNCKKVDCLLSSPAQMIPVFKELGINVIDDEGKESINEKVINKSKHPFVKLWLDYKNSEHRVNTFGQNVLDQVRYGRIYTNFNPIVDTCRVSVRKGGINFLNFPRDKETRKCFKANPGYKIVGCDYSNQENVCLANLSKDPAMLDNIINDRDAHCKLTRVVFPELAELTDDEIKDLHKEKRQISKVAGFSVGFGGNGYTISNNLNLPTEEGERIYNAYVQLYSGVFSWGKQVLEKALKTGYIESADGFKLKLSFFDEYKEKEKRIESFDKSFWEKYRHGKEEYKLMEESNNNTSKDKVPYVIVDQENYKLYCDYKDYISKYFRLKSEYLRLCLNNPCQATAAHQSKKAMYELFCYIKKRGHIKKARISNFIYDEIILEVEEELAEEYKEVIGKIMRDAADTYLDTSIIKMSADGVIGDSWYEAK